MSKGGGGPGPQNPRANGSGLPANQREPAPAHTGKLPAEELVAGLDLPGCTRDREKPVAQK